LSHKEDVMPTTSLGPPWAALAVAVTTMLLPTPAAAEASYGGTCNVGVKHRIARDVYPRTIYYSGGARCVSSGQPAVVFQDAQTYLYKLPNNNLVDRGDRVRGYTDWSISNGAYPGAETTERYRLVLDIELQTPDGSPWAEFGSDDCEGEGTPVVRCYVSKTFRVS
jgi:hypothetical protein